MSRTLWITGATGFVGSHFLYRVLRTEAAHVVAIVRDKAAQSGRERLLDALSAVARSYHEELDVAAWSARLHVVQGDIEQVTCGVELSQLPAALRTGPSEFWHIAASLCFEDRQRVQIRKQNIEGTEHALALCERLDSERFIYVSTAYTCGRCEGEIAEELHGLDRVFNNAYEESKCEAEHVVARWSQVSGRAAAIVRPSIVVGPRRTYSPGGSDTGLYGFARETARLKSMLESSRSQLSMLGDADAPVNLIPVDDLVRGMCERAAEGFAGGLVHHLTGARAPSVRTLLAVVGVQCGTGPIDVVSARHEPPSPVEHVMDRRAAFYASYLRAPKTFVRRAGAPVDVSDQELACFVRGYMREHRAETTDAVFTRELVQAGEQALVSYCCGRPEAPALVLVNAYGLPADVWVPLASALQGEFRLLTWEPRREGGQGGPDKHVADILRLLAHHGVERAFLAGFCTGADVALSFAAAHPERVLGVASVSGALNAVGAAETPFQRNMRKLAHNAARGLEHAKLYHQLLFGQRRGHYGALSSDADAAGDEAMLTSMVGTLDPNLLHLTSAPFRDADALHAYAKAMQAHYLAVDGKELEALTVPTLFVTGLRDDVAHPEASRVAAAALPLADLHELPEADHFAVYTEPSVAEMVRHFARRCEQQASTGTARSAA